MFDLKQAIKEWREAASHHVPGEDLDELEVHLLDHIEERVEAGMALEESFVLARHQLGDAREVGRELIKESGKLPAARKAPKGFSPWKAAATFAGVAFLLAFGLECFSAYGKKDYASYAMVELRPVAAPGPEPLFAGEAEALREAREPPPFDLAVELSVLKGNNLLREVVDELSLDETWGITRDFAAFRVSRNLEIQRSGNSRLLGVSYVDPKPVLAKKVLAAILDKYAEIKTRGIHKASTERLERLKRRLFFQMNAAEGARGPMLEAAEVLGSNSLLEASPNLMTEIEKLIMAEQKAFAAVESAALAHLAAVNEEEAQATAAALARLKAYHQRKQEEVAAYRGVSTGYEMARNLYQQETRVLEEMQEAYTKGRHRLAVEEVPKPLVYHSDPSDPLFAQRVLLSEIGLTTLKNAWWAVLGLGAVGGYAVHRRRRVRQGRLSHAPTTLQTTPGGRSGTDDEISWA